MKRTFFRENLKSISEIREEIERKELTLLRKADEIINALMPKLNFIPNNKVVINIRPDRIVPFKEGMKRILKHYLLTKEPKDIAGFMEFGRKRFEKGDADKIVQKLNPILLKISLVSTVNKNFNNSAINIGKINPGDLSDSV